jgi:hypothetical protein
MNRQAFKLFVSLALNLVVTVVLAAQTSTTNVKLGLWEMTVDIGMGAAMRGVDMSGMSDAEKAQAAAMMRGRGMGMGMPGMGPMTLKTCMTADKLTSGRMAPERPGQKCTSKIIKSSATAMDYTEVCTGTPATTSEMHLEALSPENIRMTGKTTTTSGGRGQSEVTTVTITGKWVADSCGDVK